MERSRVEKDNVRMGQERVGKWLNMSINFVELY